MQQTKVFTQGMPKWLCSCRKMAMYQQVWMIWSQNYHDVTVTDRTDDKTWMHVSMV